MRYFDGPELEEGDAAKGARQTERAPLPQGRGQGGDSDDPGAAWATA